MYTELKRIKNTETLVLNARIGSRARKEKGRGREKRPSCSWLVHYTKIKGKVKGRNPATTKITLQEYRRSAQIYLWENNEGTR